VAVAIGLIEAAIDAEERRGGLAAGIEAIAGIRAGDEKDEDGRVAGHRAGHEGRARATAQAGGSAQLAGGSGADAADRNAAVATAVGPCAAR
jgi:hypothetical protein